MTPNGNDCQKTDHELTLEQVTDEFDADPGSDAVDSYLTVNAVTQFPSAEEQQCSQLPLTCRSMYTRLAGSRALPDGSTQLPSEANRRSLEGVGGIAGKAGIGVVLPSPISGAGPAGRDPWGWVRLAGSVAHPTPRYANSSMAFGATAWTVQCGREGAVVPQTDQTANADWLCSAALDASTSGYETSSRSGIDQPNGDGECHPNRMTHQDQCGFLPRLYP